MKYKKVLFTKVSPEVSKAHRRFFDRHVRKAFVQYLAYTHWFDDVLSEAEIENAKKGRLPEDLDVHHIFPLSGSESDEVNSFINLTVIHKSTHTHINRNIFFQQLRDVSSMQEGETREIYIPVFKPVDRGRIVAIRSGKMRKPWVAVKAPPRDMPVWKKRGR